MVSRLVIAVVVGVIVTLGCTLIGALLASLDVSIAVVIGGFLKTYSGILGILAALLWFFSGRTTPPLV